MIGKFETNKDLVQELTASGARHVGNIASMIAGTVQDVTREVGEWVTDAIEMNEAAAAARRDADDSVDAGEDHAFDSDEASAPDYDAAANDNGGDAASVVDVDASDWGRHHS